VRKTNIFRLGSAIMRQQFSLIFSKHLNG